MALHGIRPVTGEPRPPYQLVLRLTLCVLRWTFIVIGAITAAAVLFSYIYHVNEKVYDPSLFAIGVGGLFAMGCGLMLIVLSRNSRLRLEIKRAKARCEEIADRAWEIKEAEARATSLLESQGDLIVRRDHEGCITYANDAFCATASKAREILLGTPATLTSLERRGSRVLADGTRLYDERIATSAGPRWLAWHEVVVWSRKDEKAEVQSVGRDVTERIEAERALAGARDAALAASRAKSQFLAMVSHEIRTPLNGILGMAGLLRDTELTPEQLSYVKAAQTSGETLLSLIDEILDFSKIEAGKLELDIAPFSPSALVEDAIELLGPRAQAKGLEIAADVDERLPELVLGDATRLRQVLLNLAGNAIKFTESGGVGVLVERGAGPDEVIFAVCDTGIGISAEEQARIFHEFEQADTGAARRFGGTGLGLAISRRIVERMDGRIEVESIPGRGATFRATLRLPRATSRSNSAPPLPDVSILLAASPGPTAQLTARRLRRWGADVDFTTDTDASDKTYVAALIDVSLGFDSALALAKAVRAERRIALIAPAERHWLPALKEGGFTGYLVKPIRAASLKAQLSHHAAEFEAAPASGSSKSASAGAHPALSVLVAEDNEINALLTHALLTRLGHRPTVAASGNAALESWQSALAIGARFDLVLMDVHMPGLDGYEAARRMRAAETGGNGPRTPIVALTASAFAEDRDACLAAGMDAVLVKPLDRDRLSAILAALPTIAPMAA